jgi:antitoxin component YwqK of YwqJK toxin-antitoxin module
MSAISNKTWKVMESNKFECPTGMEVKMEGWSKVGYSRTCISLRNGKWEAWDDGYKHIDGYYEQGKKQGKWVYYKPDGTVSKEVEYNQDVEVTGNELPQKNR